MDARTDAVATDAVIIGAGMAGLAAADLLIDAGRTVQVLEARDRPGGRLLNGGTTERPIDLGATWFWPGEHRVAALLQRFGLGAFAQHLAGDALYQELSGARRLQGNPIDVTSGRFVGGAQELADRLAASLPSGTIHYRTPVSAIATDTTATTTDTTATTDEAAATTDASAATTTGATAGLDSVAAESWVTVTATHSGQTRTWTASHVIVAVPPALAAADLDFSPPLPDRVAGLLAATPVWMGAVTKVVAVYEKPFWRADGLSGSAISHLGPVREIHDMSGPDGTPAAIFGFIPGTEVGAPTVDESRVRRQLGELFGPEGAEPTELHIQDWRRERWTSPPDVERLTAYQTYGHRLFQEPVADGRLHFAATETATESPGHIEGALAAAERAVASILATPVTDLRNRKQHTP
ncbi:MAG: FAD-dependent oxidoreductase [Actinomycetota bacterium]